MPMTILRAESGNDILRGGGGADTLYGDGSIGYSGDLASYSDSTAGVTVDTGTGITRQRRTPRAIASTVSRASKARPMPTP